MGLTGFHLCVLLMARDFWRKKKSYLLLKVKRKYKYLLVALTMHNKGMEGILHESSDCISIPTFVKAARRYLYFLVTLRRYSLSNFKKIKKKYYLE